MDEELSGKVGAPRLYEKPNCEFNHQFLKPASLKIRKMVQNSVLQILGPQIPMESGPQQHAFLTLHLAFDLFHLAIA